MIHENQSPVILTHEQIQQLQAHNQTFDNFALVARSSACENGQPISPTAILPSQDGIRISQPRARVGGSGYRLPKPSRAQIHRATPITKQTADVGSHVASATRTPQIINLDADSPPDAVKPIQMQPNSTPSEKAYHIHDGNGRDEDNMREIWLPKHLHGPPLSDEEKSQPCKGHHGAPATWKVYCGDLPKTDKQSGELMLPPIRCVLDDQAVYNLLQLGDGFLNKKDQGTYWPFDFNGKGKLRRDRRNRGRPAYDLNGRNATGYSGDKMMKDLVGGSPEDVEIIRRAVADGVLDSDIHVTSIFSVEQQQHGAKRSRRD